MSSTRLLQHHRNLIVNAAMQQAFAEREKALAQEGDKLFRDIRTAWLGVSACRKIDRLPEGWVRLARKIELSVNGRWRSVSTSHPKRWPAMLECKGEQLPGDLRARISLHAQACDQLTADRVAARNKMREAMRSFGTLERLIAGWPEIAPFTKGVESGSTNLPAVNIAEVNRALGLAA